MIHKNAVWHDRKRNFLGLPWTFTVYEVTDTRLFINTGFLNSREDEVRLYRFTDLTLTRSLWQKVTGTGTIHCDTSDMTMRNFDIKNIRSAQQVKELLSEYIEKARKENRVYARESLGAQMHAGDEPGDEDTFHDSYPGEPDEDDDNH